MNKRTGHYDSCKCMACETAAKVPDLESYMQRRGGWIQDLVDSMFIAFLQKDEMIFESTSNCRENPYHGEYKGSQHGFCKCPRCRNKFDRLFGDHTVTEYPADGGKVVTQWSNNAEVSRSHYIDGDPMELMSDIEMLEDCLKIKYNG